MEIVFQIMCMNDEDVSTNWKAFGIFVLERNLLIQVLSLFEAESNFPNACKPGFTHICSDNSFFPL